MDYAAVLDYLEEVGQREPNLELHTVNEVLGNFPFSIRNINFIQVAGTNGKGSTAHFIASIFQAAGLTVGLFTSPQLQSIRDTISLNGIWISEVDFASSINAIETISRTLLDKGKIRAMPTLFEYNFLAALYYFSQQEVSCAILEVGLGGEGDATTAVIPRLSLITGVSHDHTGILGRKIADIATRKAGIIKARIPVVCGCSVHSVANRVIKNKALELDAPFYNVSDSKNRLEINRNEGFYDCRYTTPDGSYSFQVHLNGEHQPFNAASAVKALEVLEHSGLSVPGTAINSGIKSVRMPGRLETIDANPGIILDGGHNVQCVRALTRFLKQNRKQQLTMIFGVLADKDYRPMVRLLMPFVKRVIITEPKSRRALAANRLKRLFSGLKDSNVYIEKDYCRALAKARIWREEILVTGSFYLVGEMRRLILD